MDGRLSEIDGSRSGGGGWRMRMRDAWYFSIDPPEIPGGSVLHIYGY